MPRTVSLPSSEEEPALALADSRLGRLVLGELIGTGGMGRVYRARDPALDRDVAVKLLARNRAPRAQARFLREAQAMASVSHPNVLPIFDVGRVEFSDGERGLFIAMEFVEGQTLRAWLTQRQRACAEILEVFIHAGRGLAAVHALGLLHRDFKPSNVMVGADGRVRVMDFGLARATNFAGADNDDENEGAAPRSLGLWLSQSGNVQGTPAYMAPEQYDGKGLDERCDQYSYCVALWEALYGARPFVEDDVEALMKAKRTASPSSPPNATVPPWIGRLLRQGLAATPAERHASMAALIQQLERGLARRGRWLAWSAGLGTAALLAAAVPLADSTEGPCHSAGKLAGVWDVERRAQVRDSILETGLPRAPETWRQIEPRLDDYAGRWVAAHDDACAAARSQQARAVELLDGRMRCLDTRLSHFRAFVEILVTDAPHAIDQVVVELGRRSSLEPCADDRYILGLAPLPPSADQRSKLRALELELARVRARWHAGDYAEARALIERALPRAESLGYGPLEAEASLLMGMLHTHSHEDTEAVRMLERAYFSAASLELSTLQVEAAVHLVHIHAVREGHYTESLEWATHARSVLETLQDDYWRAQLLDNLGTAHKENERPALAIEAYERARAIRERLLGPEHPEVASTVAHLGTVHYSQGRMDEAASLYERALSINERALGPLHPRVGLDLHGLGNVYEAQGSLDRALGYYERAWAISERIRRRDGRPNTSNTSVLLCLASVQAARGEFARSIDYYEQSLSLTREIFGPDSLDEIETLHEMGVVYEQQGYLDDAEEYFRRTVDASERTERIKEHIGWASLTSLGRVQLALHRPADARPTLERAVSLFATSDLVSITERAAAHFDLARALAESEFDVERSYVLASIARDEYALAGGDDAGAVDEITAWLDAQRS